MVDLHPEYKELLDIFFNTNKENRATILEFAQNLTEQSDHRGQVCQESQ